MSCRLPGSAGKSCSAGPPWPRWPPSTRWGRRSSERPEGWRVARPESFQAIPGHGVEAGWQERKILLGTRRLMELRGVEYSGQEERLQAIEDGGKTAMLVAEAGHLAGLGACAATLKPFARETVAALRRMGLEVLMLTGDNPRTAAAIAASVGIDRALGGGLPAPR